MMIDQFTGNGVTGKKENKNCVFSHSGSCESVIPFSGQAFVLRHAGVQRISNFHVVKLTRVERQGWTKEHDSHVGNCPNYERQRR